MLLALLSCRPGSSQKMAGMLPVHTGAESSTREGWGWGTGSTEAQREMGQCEGDTGVDAYIYRQILNLQKKDNGEGNRDVERLVKQRERGNERALDKGAEANLQRVGGGFDLIPQN